MARCTKRAADGAYDGTPLCFFFQAEDGIRGGHVTGVQTCALPIYLHPLDAVADQVGLQAPPQDLDLGQLGHGGDCTEARSEERRVGKECRDRWSPME